MNTVDKGKKAISAIKKVRPALDALSKVTHQGGLVGGVANPIVWRDNQGRTIPNRTLDTPEEIDMVNQLGDEEFDHTDRVYDVFNEMFQESIYLCL